MKTKTQNETAAELVWTTWHHIPFDNAAMTNAVVALHRDPLTAAAPELLEGCRALFSLIESGVLVRDISHDADPKWYLTALELTRALKLAQAAIAKATV